MRMNGKATALFALLAAGALIAAGCGATDGEAKQEGETKPPAGAKADTKHDGWWCDEHGIPEAECSMCSAKVAKACKAKGDWCAEHERAKSQCFKCNPNRQAFYAAKYRAKFKKEPPPIED